MTYLEASAVISPCGLYRYTLTRVWDPAKDPVVFCMLNPSTADGAQDDPTIRRCVGFARQWGYGGLTVVNLFAFRATLPRDLLKAADPVGPDNDRHIAAAAARRTVVCAWGSLGSTRREVAMRRRRAGIVAGLLTGFVALRHLGLTAAGQPMHPLYRPATVVPEPFHPATLTEAVS
ncbi:Uncharacterized protein OS=Sinorhizobium meliloti Rm41 GN=BN406_01856 PE=4 SV=1: DUF1643 [Gemmataceae bacterium]|nr:Uncharacterized protein OS=Sinorhizobium meliloti Rm41 GN=BN406_01856 PE=4 SV=1: DUF1643 [Gemmataceae bacterium]VTT96531.1 Uncharacterized protein OS=Sinorhizobium meliloti Rm41 GN=BN406_01856 PE=4 SV=1: DUF1643 [Gemmataceae bacterium]